MGRAIYFKIYPKKWNVKVIIAPSGSYFVVAFFSHEEKSTLNQQFIYFTFGSTILTSKFFLKSSEILLNKSYVSAIWNHNN